MNKKTFCYTPIAIAIMASSFNASAQTITANQTSPVEIQAGSPVTINRNVTVDVQGAPAILIDQEISLLTVEDGASVLSDQSAIDIATLPDAQPFPILINNLGTIASTSISGTEAGIRINDDTSFSQGVIINDLSATISGSQNGLYIGDNNHSNSIVANFGRIFSDSRAFNIDGEGLTLDNSGTIEGTGTQRNGTVYSDGTANNFSVINSGTIDAGVEGSGFAAEIQTEGNTFTFNNSGTIQGRGTVDAADGFRVGNPGNIGTATVEITNSGTINSESTTGHNGWLTLCKWH